MTIFQLYQRLISNFDGTVYSFFREKNIFAKKYKKWMDY